MALICWLYKGGFQFKRHESTGGDTRHSNCEPCRFTFSKKE